MRIKPYIIFAAALIILTHLIYFTHFYLSLKYTLSSDAAAWGQYGDFAGGFLNPLLSFISIVLLIKSLQLQNEANTDLKGEIKNNEKTEKLRSFEVLFFNLINSQKDLFDSFKIDKSQSSTLEPKRGAKAVIYIEEQIEEHRKSGATDNTITEHLTKIDTEDKIFGISRAFYITVLIITEKLSDEQGFSSNDRETHLKALINFTDFAQLRLVMICMQFLDYESTRHLRQSRDFRNVLQKLNLSYDLY